MGRQREVNIYDTKWAHPEELLDNTYSIPHNFDAIKAQVGSAPETWNEVNVAWRKPLFDNFMETCDAREKELADWSELYTEHGCPLEPDTKTRILLRKPKSRKSKKKLPGILFLHGGGLMGGTPECMLMMVSKLLLETGLECVTILPEYRTAPFYPYPAAVNDCHSAYLWLNEHAEELGVDTDRLLIMGGSSGGHMTLSTGFRLKDFAYHGHMPRGLISIVPVMEDVSYTHSGRISQADPEGNLQGWDWHGRNLGFQLWLGEHFGDPTLPPEAVPARAMEEDVKGLPPVWFPACAELDTGRDATYRFAQLLHEAGIFCDVHVWGGCSHLLTGGEGEQELSKRIWAVIEGAVMDALKYDFRRPWLNDEGK